MTKKELMEFLEPLEDDAEVFAGDIYGEGTFLITGAIYNKDRIELTGESLD